MLRSTTKSDVGQLQRRKTSRAAQSGRNYAALLRRMRMRAGLSYAEVAQQSGVSAISLKNIESGQHAVGTYYTPKSVIRALEAVTPTAEFMVKFADRLRAARRQSGLSLREIARRAGTDPTYLSRLERGVVPPPTWAKVQAIAACLPESEFALQAASTEQEVLKQTATAAVAQLYDLIGRMFELAYADKQWLRQIREQLEKCTSMLERLNK